MSKRIELTNLALTIGSQADAHTKMTNKSILVAFSRSISFHREVAFFLTYSSSREWKIPFQERIAPPRKLRSMSNQRLD